MLIDRLTGNKSKRFNELLETDLEKAKTLKFQQEVFEDILQATKAKATLDHDIELLELAIQQSVLEDKSLSNETQRRTARQLLEASHEGLQERYDNRLQYGLKIKALEFILKQTDSLLD